MVPGGLHDDEARAVPWLADFECRDCGMIGNHESGCIQLMEVLMARVKQAVCKVDGCLQEAIATRGLYAGLCEMHVSIRRDERRAQLNGHEPQPPVTAVDVIEYADAPAQAREQELALDREIEYESVVFGVLADIDDLIHEAEKKLSRKLREEVARRVIPQVEP